MEGHEKQVLQGAVQTLARADVSWLIEHGLTENFADINPNFRALFEIFWDAGYGAHSLDPSRIVTPDDVDRWIKNKQRDFGGIDFLFTRESA